MGAQRGDTYHSWELKGAQMQSREEVREEELGQGIDEMKYATTL